MQTAISTENLCKTYFRRRRAPGFFGGLRAYLSPAREAISAVDRVSFSVERGESVGLIGENGAGKSTTVKLLTGILTPTSGRLKTLNFDPCHERRKLAMNIGVVFGQKPQLLWDIPAGETFKLLRAMYRIDDDVYRFTYHEAVERLELAELLKTPVRLLSLGQRMRCDLAAALLHAPAVAFLDEPTIGLDVLVKERVRAFLREMRQRFGTTVLLTTHDLKDITSVCQRLLVLDKGRLLYDGDLKGFEARFARGRTLQVELERAPGPEETARLKTELVALSASVEWQGSQHLQLRFRPEVAPRVTSAVLRHLTVRDLSLQPVELETLVQELYGGKGQSLWNSVA